MNKEERKEYKKAYYEAHKKELKEKQKAYYEAHKEETKAYYEEHKQERKEYSQAYHETNRERRLRKYYCINIEQIENYNLAIADNFVDWDIHHRLETHNSDGERRIVDLTKDELKALDMYYNRPASELIFLKHKEHMQLHNKKI